MQRSIAIHLRLAFDQPADNFIRATDFAAGKVGDRKFALMAEAVRVFPAGTEYLLERRDPGIRIAEMAIGNRDHAMSAEEVGIDLEGGLGVAQGPLEISLDILGGNRGDQMCEVTLGVQLDGPGGEIGDLPFARRRQGQRREFVAAPQTVRQHGHGHGVVRFARKSQP